MLGAADKHSLLSMNPDLCGGLLSSHQRKQKAQDPSGSMTKKATSNLLGQEVDYIGSEESQGEQIERASSNSSCMSSSLGDYSDNDYYQ